MLRVTQSVICERVHSLKRFVEIFTMTIVILLSLQIKSSAASYQSYVYSADWKAVQTPDQYVPEKVVKTSQLSCGRLIDMNSIFIDQSGQIYLVATGSNKVVVLDQSMKVLKELTGFTDKTGKSSPFKGPMDVFVDKKGTIFVADTENARIVEFDKDFDFVKVFDPPTSKLFSKDFKYRPSRIALDDYGKFYVVSRGNNQGLIVLNQNGEFQTFLGTQKVKIDAAALFWRFIMTEAQIQQHAKFVPTELNAVALDTDGFIYITSSAIDQNVLQAAIWSDSRDPRYMPVRILSPGGDDIMVRNGIVPNVGDVDFDNYSVLNSIEAKKIGPSTILDVATYKNGIYSIVDGKRNKIFTYDEDGNLLTAFGGNGSQVGLFTTLVSISYYNDKIYALDKGTGSFTIFKQTEYGKVFMNAIELYNQRKYSESIDAWNQVLKYSNNIDMAFLGIGKSYLRKEMYKEAMESFKLANDRIGYSAAYKQFRSQRMESIYLLIPLIPIGLCIVIYFFLKKAKKINKQEESITGKHSLHSQIMYIFHVIFHPFDGFWDLKHEKRGGYSGAVIILAFVSLTYLIKDLFVGYVFAGNEPLNPVLSFGFVIIPFTLWCIANRCLTSLLDGEGSIKYIVVSSAYAIFPLAIVNIPICLLTNFLALDESVFITTLTYIGFTWSAILVFSAMMVINNYSFLRNIVNTLLSIITMIIIAFIIFLFINLVGRVVGFLTNIYTELRFRI